MRKVCIMKCCVVSLCKWTRKVVICSLVAGGVGSLPAGLVEDILGEVSENSYRSQFLSLPVTEGCARGYPGGVAQADLPVARATIFNNLSTSLGSSQVSYQDFSFTGYSGKNIVGVLPGSNPSQYGAYLVGAHYDSAGSPGADDNASGMAGLMEAARVLSRYQFGATLYFVAFDLEEDYNCSFARGSTAFAATAKAQGIPINGMISMDMIAFNFDNTVTVTDTGTGWGSSVANAMGRTGLSVDRRDDIDYSDHMPFKNQGFNACLTIEHLQESVFTMWNPYEHDSGDRYGDFAGNTWTDPDGHVREYIDYGYATKIVKGAIDAIVSDAASVAPVVNLVPEPAAGLLLCQAALMFVVLRKSRNSG